MAFIVGANNILPRVCSTEWIAEIVKAELFASGHHDVEMTENNNYNLFIDFGGALCRGIVRATLDGKHGPFHFYTHQRAAISSMLNKAIGKAAGEVHVELQSQYHVLCIATSHALDLLYAMDEPLLVGMEEDASRNIEEVISTLRTSPYVELAPQHRMDVH
jgi:hypothetical protein